jgi:hypothetical protein
MHLNRLQKKRVNEYNEWLSPCKEKKVDYIPLLLLVVVAAPVLARSCVTTTCSAFGSADCVDKYMFNVGTGRVLQRLVH